jgi:hypothetical protein
LIATSPTQETLKKRQWQCHHRHNEVQIEGKDDGGNEKGVGTGEKEDGERVDDVYAKEGDCG